MLLWQRRNSDAFALVTWFWIGKHDDYEQFFG
jgi:hypothetical protein